MKLGSTPKPPRLPARLSTAVLVIGILLLINPGTPLKIPRLSLHNELVEQGSVQGFGKLGDSLIFYSSASNEAPVYVLADVAIDEDFVKQVDDWETQTYRMVGEANTLLAQVGLTIKVAAIHRWRSEDAVGWISAHLNSAEQQVERAPGRLFLAITGQGMVRHDGYAQESGNRVIVQFYHDSRRRNAALIAHEVGHLLGANHHEDEEECSEDGCVMDKAGVAYATTWCQHHREKIAEEIASRLSIQES